MLLYRISELRTLTNTSRYRGPGPLQYPAGIDRPISVGAVHVDVLGARKSAPEGDVQRNRSRERRRCHRGCADQALAVLQHIG